MYSYISEECGYSPSSEMCTMIAEIMRYNTESCNKRVYNMNGYGRLFIIRPPKFLTGLSAQDRVQSSNNILKSLGGIRHSCDPSVRFVLRGGKLVDMYSLSNMKLDITLKDK